jgi:hypothetical protein
LKEPKRIKGWVNLYARNAEHSDLSDLIIDGVLYKASTYAKASKDQADLMAGCFPQFTRIACIEIDVLEGQGLDGSAR